MVGHCGGNPAAERGHRRGHGSVKRHGRSIKETMLFPCSKDNDYSFEKVVRLIKAAYTEVGKVNLLDLSYQESLSVYFPGWKVMELTRTRCLGSMSWGYSILMRLMLRISVMKKWRKHDNGELKHPAMPKRCKIGVQERMGDVIFRRLEVFL